MRKKKLRATQNVVSDPPGRQGPTERKQVEASQVDALLPY